MTDELDDLSNEEEEEEEEDTADFLARLEEEEVEAARAGKSNGARLLRQHQFHLAAQYVAIALCAIPAVRRVVLFGSVALPLKQEKSHYKAERRAHLPWVWHECADIDLAVWVNDLSVLKSLQRARGQALNFLLATHGIGVAHHQVDIFIMKPENDRYLGRLCTFGACPKEKRECNTSGCGKTPLLKAVEGFTWRPDAIHPAHSICLYDVDGNKVLHESFLLRLMTE